MKHKKEQKQRCALGARNAMTDPNPFQTHRMQQQQQRSEYPLAYADCAPPLARPTAHQGKRRSAILLVALRARGAK